MVCLVFSHRASGRVPFAPVPCDSGPSNIVLTQLRRIWGRLPGDMHLALCIFLPMSIRVASPLIDSHRQTLFQIFSIGIIASHSCDVYRCIHHASRSQTALQESRRQRLSQNDFRILQTASHTLGTRTAPVDNIFLMMYMRTRLIGRRAE